jgi:hypothetical protein
MRTSSAHLDMGEMIFFPAMSAYVADLAPPGRKGEYMGRLNSISLQC